MTSNDTRLMIRDRVGDFIQREISLRRMIERYEINITLYT